MLRTADMAVIEYRRTAPERMDRRGGLRGLLGRLGLPAGDAVGDDAGRTHPEPPALASHHENALRALRDNANAARASVQGTEQAALDAAFSVYEAALEAAECERDGYAEALKAIRLYASDAQSRVLAARALSQRKGGAAWDAGLHVTGRDRFPFLGEFDA